MDKESLKKKNITIFLMNEHYSTNVLDKKRDIDFVEINEKIFKLSFNPAKSECN